MLFIIVWVCVCVLFKEYSESFPYLSSCAPPWSLRTCGQTLGPARQQIWRERCPSGCTPGAWWPCLGEEDTVEQDISVTGLLWLTSLQPGRVCRIITTIFALLNICFFSSLHLVCSLMSHALRPPTPLPSCMEMWGNVSRYPFHCTCEKRIVAFSHRLNERIRLALVRSVNRHNSSNAREPWYQHLRSTDTPAEMQHAPYTSATRTPRLP